MEIQAANSAADIENVRELFEEYWRSFGFSPCFQGFGEEVAGLPGKYAAPGGRLILAIENGKLAGCGALRQVDSRRAEAKRLYVRAEFRGRGLGAALLEYLIEEARAAGYLELVGDTMPEMRDALALYKRRGFELTGPYSENPTPGAVYIRLIL
jgi:putative acetyltransferase